jgi:hypothetical protein
VSLTSKLETIQSFLQKTEGEKWELQQELSKSKSRQAELDLGITGSEATSLSLQQQLTDIELVFIQEFL